MRVVKRVVSFAPVFFSERFAARSATEWSGVAHDSGESHAFSRRVATASGQSHFFLLKAFSFGSLSVSPLA